MKLALIRQKYNPHGGAERFVNRAVCALVDQGTAVTLITRSWPSGELPFQPLIVNPWYVGSLWRDWSFARAARAAAQSFDLVQSHERMPGCDIYRAGDGVHAQWLCHRARVDSAWRTAVNRWHPYHRYVLAAERQMFTHPRLRAVICNSQMVRDEIVRWFGVSPDRLPVIYSGVDNQQFHPDLRCHRQAMRQQLGLNEQPVFLYVGSGFERKGVAVFLRTLREIPNTQAVIVGRDKKSQHFVELAQKLGIAPRVRFVGGQMDVKPFYGLADALFLPTLYDPFPNVALEAMAAGLPVVTSFQCGAAEFIQSGQNGFVCDALDQAGFVAALTVLTDLDLAKVMGMAARNTVLPYNLDRMAENMLALYHRLMRGEPAVAL